MNAYLTIKYKYSILLVFALFFLSSSESFAGDDKHYIIGESVTFKSNILGEERTILVNLPPSYSYTKAGYPVLYILDGGTHFHHASGITTFLATAGRIPHMIVIAVTNVDRNRDFSPSHVEEISTSGGAEKFLSFLEKELIPFVDRNYRTISYKVLCGHSFGGTFATFSLLQKPKLFNAYISISPFLMYDNNSMVMEANKKLKSKYDNVQYFMTVGNEPAYFETLKEFSELITSRSPGGFELTYQRFDEEDHGSVPHLSMYYGLRSIFSDYSLSDETFREGLAAIDKHYNSLSVKYGADVSAPEPLINQLGYYFLNDNQPDKAIETFKANVNRFPESANVYDSLGEAYEKNGQAEEAARNYSMAVEKGKKTGDANLGLYKANLERVKGEVRVDNK